MLIPVSSSDEFHVYTLLMQMGTSETIGAIYWRAKKALGDASVLTVPSVQ